MHKICEAHSQRCLENNDDFNLALLHRSSTPTDTGVLSSATLFNRPIRTMLLQINREPIKFNAVGEHCEA